jgi:hypothetical protein
VIEYIERLAIEIDVPIYAKYHPSSKEIDMILSDNIKIIKDISELPEEYKYVSLTYFSSYAITLLKEMPFFLINPNGKMNLKYIYPDFREMYIESYDKLKSKMNLMLKDKNAYYEYWKDLIRDMNELGF